MALVSAAAILWPVYKTKTAERELAEAARSYLVRADQGDAIAQYRLGDSYRRGEGVPLDYAEALRWYRKAANQGDVKAQYGVAFMYRNGQGVPQDTAEAVHLLRKAADQGYAQAQYQLGLRYSCGEGVSRDDAEALRWYRKAADQNFAPAQRELGFSYFRGQTVPRDYAEALRWFLQAAGRGDKLAQVRLAVSYWKGEGAPRNYIAAARWFGKVAASCSDKIGHGPVGRLMSIIGILAGVVILAVPQRRWGRFNWMPSAVLFAVLAAIVDRELLAKHLLWVAVNGVIAALLAIVTIGLAVEGTRGEKRGGDQGDSEAAS